MSVRSMLITRDTDAVLPRFDQLVCVFSGAACAGAIRQHLAVPGIALAMLLMVPPVAAWVAHLLVERYPARAEALYGARHGLSLVVLAMSLVAIGLWAAAWPPETSNHVFQMVANVATIPSAWMEARRGRRMQAALRDHPA